jgi:hypothetical protein
MKNIIAPCAGIFAALHKAPRPGRLRGAENDDAG